MELVCTANHKNVDVWLLRMWCWLQPGVQDMLVVELFALPRRRHISRGLTHHHGVLVQVLLSQLTRQVIFTHVLQCSNNLLPGRILFFAQPHFKHRYSPPRCGLVIVFDLSYLALDESQVRSEYCPIPHLSGSSRTRRPVLRVEIPNIRITNILVSTVSWRFGQSHWSPKKSPFVLWA